MDRRAHALSFSLLSRGRPSYLALCPRLFSFSHLRPLSSSICPLSPLSGPTLSRPLRHCARIMRARAGMAHSYTIVSRCVYRVAYNYCQSSRDTPASHFWSLLFSSPKHPYNVIDFARSAIPTHLITTFTTFFFLHQNQNSLLRYYILVSINIQFKYYVRFDSICICLKCLITFI